MLEQCISSFMDGRVRLRHEILRDPVIVAQIKGFLPSVPGVQDVCINTRIGSLLLTYDAEVLSKDALLDILQQGENLLDLSQYTLVKKTPCSTKKKPCSCLVRRPLNQALLLTMGGTMLFAYAGSKQVHIVAGWLFMGFNAYHIWKRRKLL